MAFKIGGMAFLCVAACLLILQLIHLSGLI